MFIDIAHVVVQVVVGWRQYGVGRDVTDDDVIK